MGVLQRIRDKVESAADRASSYVERKAVVEPRVKSWNKAAKHYNERQRDIDDMEQSGKASPRLANKWREREDKRFDTKKIPRRERAYNFVGSGSQTEAGNWGQNFKERFKGDLGGGYKKVVHDRRTGKSTEVYVPPAKERIRRSMYGDNGKGGASKSYRKTVPREFGIARNQDQFGNVVMFGKPTRGSSSKMGGGWGMMFGSGSSVRSFDSPRSSGGGRRRGRKGRGGDSMFLGNTGWLF